MTMAPILRRSVLLVEDDAVVRDSFRRYLEMSGFDVIEVDTVDAALAQLPMVPIAAAILDVRMPKGRSGLEVLEFMRRHEQWQRVPVIILTGVSLSEQEEEIIRRDRAYVFYKPHGYEEIVQRLYRMLLET